MSQSFTEKTVFSIMVHGQLEAIHREKKIILTNGFVKKSQKTPKNELDKAKKYKEDYKRRMENE